MTKTVRDLFVERAEKLLGPLQARFAGDWTLVESELMCMEDVRTSEQFFEVQKCVEEQLYDRVRDAGGYPVGVEAEIPGNSDGGNPRGNIIRYVARCYVPKPR